MRDRGMAKVYPIFQIIDADHNFDDHLSSWPEALVIYLQSITGGQ